MTAVALLLLPALAGWLTLDAVFRHTPAGAWLRAPLAFGLGLAASAAGLGVWSLAGLSPGRLYVGVESLALGGVVLALVARRRRAVRPPGSERPTSRHGKGSRALAAAFTAIATLDLALFAAASRAEPHGEWDAWAIWNLKARFILYGGEYWRNLFSPLLPHPDYPLLLPWTVARLWIGSGDASQLAPMLVALAFAVATVVLLVAAVRDAAGRKAALVAGLLLLTTLGFSALAAAQYADVPLAFYFLAVVVCVSLAGRTCGGAVAWTVCAGAMAGAAALTKNEGILVLVVAAVSLAATTLRRLGPRTAARRLAAFVTGAGPFVVVLVWCKLAGTWENDLVAGADAVSLVGRAADLRRHFEVVRGLLKTSLSMGTPVIAALAAVALRSPRAGADRCLLAPGILAVALVAAGYYLVLLTTPHDLSWHVATAASRLVMQLWPAALFLVFAATDSGDAGRPLDSPGADC